MPTKHCALCESDFIYADCVEGGRADLARKVLETLPTIDITLQR